MSRLPRTIATAGFAVALTVSVQPPLAQEQGAQARQCDERERVLTHLAKKYQEAPVAVGLTSGGGLIEVLSTGSGETWTIIVSNPDGVSCLVAAGEGWRKLEFDANAGDPQA